MGNESAPLYPNEEARDAALEADRVKLEAPLPYSDVRHYPHETARQVSLAAAEGANIAKAAQERGMTSEEYTRARAEAAKRGQTL